jgi:hypothetical protein
MFLAEMTIMTPEIQFKKTERLGGGKIRGIITEEEIEGRRC